MSQETLLRRAASIRKTWSRTERQRRAVASDLRCLELIVRLTMGPRSQPTLAYAKARS